MAAAKFAPRKGRGRLGRSNYVNILRCLAQDPADAQAIAEFHRIRCLLRCRLLLRRMLAAGLIHEDRWIPASKGPPLPLWAFGPGPRAPKPKGSATYFQPLQPGIELLAIAHVLRLLKQAPMTARELSEATGTGHDRLRRLVKLMAARGKSNVGVSIVYIERWEKRGECGGKRVPVYAFGINKEPATKPKPVPMSEACKKYRANKRAREEALARRAANASVFHLATTA